MRQARMIEPIMSDTVADMRRPADCDKKKKSSVGFSRMILTAAAIAAAGLCLLGAHFIMASSASYADDARTGHSADIAGYAVDIDIPASDGTVMQNEACSFEKIISLDNRSDTAVAYDIIVSLNEGKSWPEGLEVTLLAGDEEITGGTVTAGRCTFTDDTWQLAPGEKITGVYGLKISTTYDTDPGEYRFGISTATYQLD